MSCQAHNQFQGWGLLVLCLSGQEEELATEPSFGWHGSQLRVYQGREQSLLEVAFLQLTDSSESSSNFKTQSSELELSPSGSWLISSLDAAMSMNKTPPWWMSAFLTIQSSSR